MSTEYATALVVQLKGFTAYRLANLAGVAIPDTTTSAGATFLEGVRDHVAESLTWADPEDPADVRRWLEGDGPAEVADSAPDDYTHPRWAQYVDLCAYTEDVSEYGASIDPANPTDSLAFPALYAIALRAVGAMVAAALEAVDQ